MLEKRFPILKRSSDCSGDNVRLAC